MNIEIIKSSGCFLENYLTLIDYEFELLSVSIIWSKFNSLQL